MTICVKKTSNYFQLYQIQNYSHEVTHFCSVFFMLCEFSAYTNISWPDESFANVHHKVPMHPMKAKFKAAQHNRMEQTLLALFNGILLISVANANGPDFS